ncbi:sigma 54-interacting transcriptional regulator [Rossellomorea sp. y25]|uniref:sigma 54-interacting transcriptional regulator n=1 Tax=Rossellomorea sp. y25 TaxID=3118174 RepID=UPI0030E1CC7C
MKRYIGNHVQIKGYSIEKGLNQQFDNQVVLITGDIVFQYSSKYVQGAKKVIIARRALSYEKINQVFSLKEQTNVLLVNDTEESCFEAIEQLKSHGFQSLNFFPYYPGINSFKECNVAVTPGEVHLVPNGINHIIDIGNRQVDITTITEIMFEFGILRDSGVLASSEFVRDVIELTRHLWHLNQKLDDSNLLLSTIFDKFPKALLFCDKDGSVTYTNEKMKWIFEGQSLLGTNVLKLLGSEFDLRFAQEHEDTVCVLNDHTYIVSVDPVKKTGDVLCYLMEFENYDTLKKLDKVVRTKVNHKKFVARYSFSHLYSRNHQMMQLVELAQRMAKRDSTILIQGESGTGKELLAQAIHNDSLRYDLPFVAVNFAALSSSILESELFGYEEGAFTGAKKGGKRGLFEEAHRGTIFMDEIGDAPLDLQVKLLRVLQEGVIRRVGGNEQVPIDVRIIAATNLNLEEKVKEGMFREDLYYRLNVLPLDTIPLRKRPEDILPLMQHYLTHLSGEEIYHVHEYMEAEVINFFLSHPWPGNVRELVNIVEYMVNVKSSRKKISLDDLPFYILKEGNLIEKECVNPIFTKEEEVLLIIDETSGIGRRKIVQELLNRGLKIGESKVKRILEQLKEKQLIEVNRGVRGCVITEKGKDELKKFFVT